MEQSFNSVQQSSSVQLTVDEILKDVSCMRWLTPIIRRFVKISHSPETMIRLCLHDDEKLVETKCVALFASIGKYLEIRAEQGRGGALNVKMFANYFPELWNDPPFHYWDQMVAKASNIMIDHINNRQKIEFEQIITSGIVTSKVDILLDKIPFAWKIGEDCFEDIAQISLQALILDSPKAILCYTSFDDSIVTLDTSDFIKQSWIMKKLNTHG